MTDGPEPQDTEGQPGIVVAALSASCPKCGTKGMLFDGVARFAPRCRVCGLDYGQFNVGDGPAAFLTLIIGAVIVILAVWVELSWSPPWWVHVILWTPLTAVSVVYSLRVAKAVLLIAEYRRKAGLGRLKDE